MKKRPGVLWRIIRATLYLLLFCLLAAFLLILVTLYQVGYDQGSVSSDDQQLSRKEEVQFEERRYHLFFIIHAQIGEYYKQNGYYPKSLKDLSVATTDEFVKYRRGIQYISVMRDKKSTYHLRLINGCCEGIGKDCTDGKCVSVDFH